MSTTVASEGTSQNTVTPTAEETANNKLLLERNQAAQPGMIAAQSSGLNLVNQLLTSFGDKSSNQWQSLIGGVTSDQQQKMIAEQDRYLTPQLQSQGIYDSGTANTGRLRAATDLSNQNAQFNVGVLQNALNLALSGQAQVQSPVLGQTSTLSNNLAGLRSTTTTGTQTQTSNPFLQSFYSSLGNTMGGGNLKANWNFGGK